MFVTISEFKRNFDKYFSLVSTEDIFITQSGNTMSNYQVLMKIE